MAAVPGTLKWKSCIQNLLKHKSSVIIHYIIRFLMVIYPYKQSHSDYLFPVAIWRLGTTGLN